MLTRWWHQCICWVSNTVLSRPRPLTHGAYAGARARARARARVRAGARPRSPPFICKLAPEHQFYTTYIPYTILHSHVHRKTYSSTPSTSATYRTRHYTAEIHWQRANFTSPQTRWIVLPDDENRMTVSSFIWTKHWNVIKRQTDGQNPIASTVVCIASNADTL